MSTADKALDAVIAMADLILKEWCPDYKPWGASLFKPSEQEARKEHIEACALYAARMRPTPLTLTATPSYEFIKGLAELRDQAVIDRWRGDES